MLVLIDESGCCGFGVKGVSPFFTLAMVIFDDFKEAEGISKEIANLRSKLNVKKEFKFSKTHPNVKKSFFSTISNYNFLVRALIVNKSRVTSNHLKQNCDHFYNYFLKILLEYDAGILNNSIIKIDGVGTKLFRRAMKSYLREQLGSNKIKKISFVDSQKDNLIQLADMVVGAIARTVSTTKDKNNYFDILAKTGKIDNIWNFK